MGRETRTAVQLRAMVQVRLNALPEVGELMSLKPDAGPVAGPVQRTRVDQLGRNWDIAAMSQGVGFHGPFRAIVDELRGRYDLVG